MSGSSLERKKGKELELTSLMRAYSNGITSWTNSERYLPNSLCMHLIIETFYNQVAPLLSTEEAVELGFIELENIPSILFSYLQKEQSGI